MRHNCTLQVFPCHWLYLVSLPYISFWERLSGKKMGIEAQLYPNTPEWLKMPIGGMDTFWPLKHNCTQIRGEQTTDQGDELYSIQHGLCISIILSSLCRGHANLLCIIPISTLDHFQQVQIISRPALDRTNK